MKASEIRMVLIAAAIAILPVPLSAQKSRQVETGGGIRDIEIIKIPRYQFENGYWAKYRRGEFDNLRLTMVAANRNVLSRSYAEEHREISGQYGSVPIFEFHYHTRHCGAVLSDEQVDRLKNIAMGDTVMVQSRSILNDFDTREFDFYLTSILSQTPARRADFFLWICRTKNKKKDVIRIVDTGELEGFDIFYWEIPYDTYLTLFE